MTTTLIPPSLSLGNTQPAPPVRPKPVQYTSLHSLNTRTDPAGRCLREQHQAVCTLSDDDVFEASVQAGLTKQPPPASRVRFIQKSDRVENEKLREQLADF